MHLQYYDFKKREWEVENIIGHRKHKSKRSSNSESKIEYLIKWKGFQSTTWEPEENLANCKEILNEYLEKVNGKGDTYINNVDKNNNDNKINIHEEEKNIQNITMDEFCQPVDNKNNSNNKEKNKLKIQEIIGVRFPSKKGESIVYKVKFRNNGKKQIKMIKNENNIIPNNKLVKFYEKFFF